jgi:Restriction endonuclease
MPAAELCDRPVTVEQVWGRPAITVWQNLGIDGFTVQGEYPIQVKRRDNVPRHVVDSFETAVERYGAARGLLIAFGFTKDAMDEAARVQESEGADIELITTAELLSRLSGTKD